MISKIELVPICDCEEVLKVQPRPAIISGSNATRHFLCDKITNALRMRSSDAYGWQAYLQSPETKQNTQHWRRRTRRTCTHTGRTVAKCFNDFNRTSHWWHRSRKGLPCHSDHLEAIVDEKKLYDLVIDYGWTILSRFSLPQKRTSFKKLVKIDERVSENNIEAPNYESVYAP